MKSETFLGILILGLLSVAVLVTILARQQNTPTVSVAPPLLTKDSVLYARLDSLEARVLALERWNRTFSEDFPWVERTIKETWTPAQ